MYLVRRENIHAAVVLACIAQSACFVGSVNIEHSMKNFGPTSWDPNKFLQELSRIQDNGPQMQPQMQRPQMQRPQERFQELRSSSDSFATGSYLGN